MGTLSVVLAKIQSANAATGAPPSDVPIQPDPVVPPTAGHDLIWGGDTSIVWGGDTVIDWPGI